MFSCATYPICVMLIEEDLRDIGTVYRCIYIYIIYAKVHAVTCVILGQGLFISPLAFGPAND